MMISFKEFLIESRSAPLYHGTGSDSAIKIIKENLFRSSTEYYDAHRKVPYESLGVSLSRNLKFAYRFANRYYEQQDTVVFELDQKKLSHNYKIQPVAFFTGGRRMGEIHNNNEYEERVEGSIRNADKYITKVIMFTKPAKPNGFNKNSDTNYLLSHPKLYYDGKFVNK